MQVTNSAQQWGLLSIALHWLVAAVVPGLFLLGLWMTGLSYYDTWYKQGPIIHKGVGVILFVLLLLRTLWRLLNVTPDPLPNQTNREIILTTFVHYALYLMLFAITISGYLISTADGRAIEVFGWFEIPGYPLGIEQQEEIAGKVHLYLAVVTMAVAGMHALGALKHHFIDGDETLLRMLRIR